jgi:hypothetical protein
MSTFSRVAALATFVGLAPTVSAKDCFCVRERDQTPYYDCVEGYAGPQRIRFVECRLKARHPRMRIPGGAEMEKIPNDTPPCRPCEVVSSGNGHVLSMRGLSMRMRGDDGEGGEDDECADCDDGQESTAAGGDSDND